METIVLYSTIQCGVYVVVLVSVGDGAGAVMDTSLLCN